MAQMNTSHRYLYDAAPATLLRSRNAAAITATADSDELVLNTVDGYWNTDNELADETFAIVVNVTEFDSTTGDEAYTFELQATDGAGTEVPEVTLGTYKVDAVGQYVFLVDAATANLIGDFGGVKLAVTVAGTTPSINYFAWMTQIRSA